MRDVTGHCPSCHAEGPVGQPCSERGCDRRGYRFIPAESFEKLRNLPPGRTDPRIGQCIGEYLLVDVLGQGGFGKVYLALQLPILMRTALKVMERTENDPELADALAKRFEGEAAALATLTHPNIVRLLKYGTHEGVPYLVMEFVEGNRTLRHEMNDGALAPGRTDPAVTAHVLRQILNALEAAHDRSIVHRDVKPENVMLQEVSGDPWYVKVLDFGLAKFVEERNETSLMVGTPAYMAPEQITRKGIGPWTDLYAVGVLAFRLATGRLPFLGDSTQETYAKKLDPEYDPLAQPEARDLPPLLAGFLRKAMARDPDSRFRTAAEFRKSFDAVADSLGQASALTAPIAGQDAGITPHHADPDAPVAPMAPAPKAPVAAAVPPAKAPAAAADLPLDVHAFLEPSPVQGGRARKREPSQGASMTEHVRDVGDQAFAQMGSPSVVTTQRRTITQPRIVEIRPRRRILGTIEFVLLLLVGLGVGVYLYAYGPTTAPVKAWLGRAEKYMDEGAGGTGPMAGAPAADPSKTTAVAHIVTQPPGARIHNEETNDDLGRTPTDVLVPPGATLRVHVQMNGYKDEVLTLAHDEVIHHRERSLNLKRDR